MGNAKGKDKELFDEMFTSAIDGIEHEPNHNAAIIAISNIQKTHKGNINELMSYRENVPVLINYICDLMKTLHGYKFMSIWNTTPDVNNHKRWSKSDENLLIDLVCKGDSIRTIATIFHRSPSAIQTKITSLVGVKRLSQQVAGKFIGTANGADFNAELVGTIYKK